MAEDTYISVPIKDQQTGEEKYTVYSTTGERRSAADFTKAIQKYDTDGEEVKGFTFLPTGFVNNARYMYEQGIKVPSVMGLPSFNIPGNQALQQGAANIGNSVTPPTSVQGVGDFVRGNAWLAAQVPSLLASNVKTPERLLETGAMLAAGATGGTTSLGPTMWKAARYTGVANLIAQHLFGTAKQKSPGQEAIDVVIEMGKAAAAAGAPEVFKRLIGKGVDKQAQQGVATELADYLKKKFGPLASDPKILEADLSTPSGVADAVQKGLKGMRGNIDRLEADMTTDLIGITRGLIPVGDVKPLNAEVKKLIRLQNNFLDNIDADATVLDPIKKSIQDSTDIITSFINKVVNKGTTPLKDKMMLIDLMGEYEDRVAQIGTYAPLFAAFKRAGMDREFDVRKFQYEMQGMTGITPEAAAIAGRGANLTVGGMDATVRQQLPIGKVLGNVPLLDKVPGIDKFNMGKDIGTRYVGKVPYSKPAVEQAAAAQMLTSMKDYFNTYTSKDYRR